MVKIIERGKSFISKRLVDPNPKNDAIPFKDVYIVDSETNSVSESSVPLWKLLSRIDRHKHFVQLVASQPKPLVRVVDQHEAYKKKKARRETKKRQVESKHIQCTWQLAAGDLQHKLEKVNSEILKGNRVEVTFLPKHGVPVPPPRLRSQMIQDALAFLLEHCKQYQPQTEQGLRVMLHLEPKNHPQ